MPFVGGGGIGGPRKKDREPEQGRNVRKVRHSKGQGGNVRPTGVFGPLPKKSPVQRIERKQQEAKTRRAQQRAPARPVPALPVLKHPTRRQTAAARELVQRSVQRQGKGSQTRRVVREIESDPRLRGRVRAIRSYTRAEENRLALQALEAASRAAKPPRYGLDLAGRLAALTAEPVSPAERLAAGRAILASQHQPEAKAGRPDRRVSAGIGPEVNLSALGRAVMGATSLGGDSPENRFFKRAAGDVKTLATGPFVGAYTAGVAGVELAKGNSGPAKKVASGVLEGLKESVPGHLLRGDLVGAAESFNEHPVLGLLDVSAAGAVAGRTAGAVARGVGGKASEGGLRGALGRAGSTVRPPIALTDDASAGLVGRTYSRDLVRKAVQVAADARREPLRRSDGSVVTVMDRGRQVPVLRAGPVERGRLQRRQADFDASRANQVERLVRDRADRELRVRKIRGRNARDLVSMVVEGTITSARNFDRDLRAHADRIRGELERHEKQVAAGKPPVYRTQGELKAARDRVALVEKVLANPKAMRQRERIVAAGVEIGRKLNTAEAEAQRLGLLDPKRAARSRLVPAAVEHLGARHYAPEELRVLADRGEDISAEALKHGAIRHSDGRFMSNAEVEQALRDRGRDPGTVAYLPHRLDTRGNRAFHTQFRPGSRSTLDKAEGRTGEAYRRGATESSTQLIREHGVRQQVHIAKAQQLDRMVADQGVKRPDGRYFTAKEAAEAARRVADDTGEEYVPMRAFAAKLDERTRKMIRDDYQGPGGLDTLGQRLLDDRVVHAPDEPGKPRARNVVLVPKTYVDQLNKHLRPAGSIEKFFQLVNRPFRFAVLAQPRWLTGNIVEPYLVRLPSIGSGINVFGLGLDVTAATRIVRQMEKSADPKVRHAAQQIRAQQFGGLLIGGRGASVRRSAEEIPMYGKVVGQLPVVRQGAELVRLAGRALMAPGNAYFRLNRVIESGAQRAAFGREVRRDLREFKGSWTATLRLHRAALEDVGKGLVDTSAQRRFMRAQHELLGKYEGFNPATRAWVQTVTPFLPWALNAARFVFWTMPAHRTVQASLLLKVNDVVQKDWEEIHKEVPPGGLKLAVPNGKGGWVDLARYTPYGLTGPAAEGELQGVTDQFAPQLSGVIAALEGKDPFGRELRVKPTKDNPAGEASGGDKARIAAYGLLEALVPYVSQARRLRERGGTAYSDSTIVSPKVKPETVGQMGAVRRTFDPFRPVYLRAKGGSVSTGGGSGGGGLLERAAEREAQGGLTPAQLDLLERAAGR